MRLKHPVSTSASDLAVLQRAVSQHGHQLMIPTHSHTTKPNTMDICRKVCNSTWTIARNGYASETYNTFYARMQLKDDLLNSTVWGDFRFW